MSLNFPANPQIGEQYALGDRTWEWDGTAWTQQNKGPRGPRGVPGQQAILSLKGASPDVSGLPATADFGDAWLADDKIYFYADDQWTEVLDYSPDAPTNRDHRVIHVSVAGNDGEDGVTRDRAVRSIARGMQLAADHPDPVVVQVYPGDYVEEGSLVVPPGCGVIGVGGQYTTNVIAAEGFEQENMFLVSSGSYVQGFAFRNQQVDSFENPSGGFAVAFAPGARIARSPYVRDISQVSNLDANIIAMPLDPENANPLVGNGGGTLLADRAVLDPYSTFPYMLAFGATPRSPNGMGYVAKNGAGINGISSITIFSRVAFYALDGGQITLNNSGTQFGDISMYAKGSTPVVNPYTSNAALAEDSATADAITDNQQALIDGMWAAVSQVYPGFAADSDNEAFTRFDATLFLRALAGDLYGGTEMTMQSFALGLFDYAGEKVYDVALEPVFIFAWHWLRDEIKAQYAPEPLWPVIDGLVDKVVRTVNDPERIDFGSLIESLGHQFNNAGAGVNRLALPVNFRQPGRNRPVPFSVIQEDGGRVRWSGSDEQNLQYFGDDFRIDGRTGRVSGRAFDRTVRQIARRMANARGLI